MENTEKTQLDKALEALMELKPNVTAQDRRESGHSDFTLVKYLSGRGRDLDTAMTMLQYFRKRISDREREIA